MISSVLKVEEKIEASVDLPTQSLHGLAAKFVFGGPDTLSDGETLGALAAVKERIAKAEAWGLSPAEVVRSVLRPIFDVQNHCRCSICQEHCLICRRPSS